MFIENNQPERKNPSGAARSFREHEGPSSPPAQRLEGDADAEHNASRSPGAPSFLLPIQWRERQSEGFVPLIGYVQTTGAA